MQTPKQNTPEDLDASEDCMGIVPPHYRTCTDAEREKIEAEEYAKHATELRSLKGMRLWWLKWRLKRNVAARIEELEEAFKDGI